MVGIPSYAGRPQRLAEFALSQPGRHPLDEPPQEPRCGRRGARGRPIVILGPHLPVCRRRRAELGDVCGVLAQGHEGHGVEQQSLGKAVAAARSPERQLVGRRRSSGFTEIRKRVGSHIAALDVERVRADPLVLHRERNAQPPRFGEQLVHANRRRDIRLLVSQVIGSLIDLTEPVVNLHKGEVDVRKVRRRQARLHHAGEAHVVHDITEPDVINPQFRLGDEHRFVDAMNGHGDFGHPRQIRGPHTRILDLDQVRAVTSDERGRIASARLRAGRGLTPQPRVLDLRA